MTFDTPGRLWLVAGVVALATAYVVMQLRRKEYAVRFANLDLLASIAPRRPGWQRHIPAVALVAALLCLVLAFARPTRDVRIQREEATVMLAVDTSTSMQATDVQPDRLSAARESAEQFADKLPGRIRLGLISFADSARVVVPPTTDRDAVKTSLERLSLSPRTAIGEAVFAGLDAIAASSTAADARVPARIVLLSDGATTAGRPNEAAASAASGAGVPVTTIAFGTDEGVVEVQGELVPVPVDADALHALAASTGGSFFEAETAGDLRAVYNDLGSSIGYITAPREVTAWFVGLGLLLAFGAAIGSLVWSARLP